jgi:copper chaperone NosL
MTKNRIERRDALKILTVSGLAAATACLLPVQDVDASSHKTDGTPMQFFPKNGPDPEPFKNDVEKYPRCPYCGMKRKMWNHSRYLIHYSDDMVDPTCSLHCAAIGLSLNLDRTPKGIYVADFGSTQKIKPLINVDEATFLIGSKLKGTMTAKSKMAFASKTGVETVQKQKGGEIGNFDFALTKAYLSMAMDTMMIRKKRAAKKMKS